MANRMRLTAFLLQALVANHASASTDSWDWKTDIDPRRGVPEKTFIVNTIRAGDQISGSACYVYAFGNRIDCPEECNVSGTVDKDGVADLVVHSEYFDKDMSVEAKFDGNYLAWRSSEYGPDHDRTIQLRRTPPPSKVDIRTMCEETAKRSSFDDPGGPYGRDD